MYTYQSTVQYNDNNYDVYNSAPLSLQIPNVLNLELKSFKKILIYLYQSLVDEATTTELYSKLSKEAPNELHQDFIEHAYEDKLDHLQTFTQLYRHFTGQNPCYKINPIEYENYSNGLLIALKEKLKFADFYRAIQLSTTNQLIKDTFYMAMVDELEHATQFNTLYSNVKSN